MGPARLKADVLSLHVAELAHLLAERIPPLLPGRIGRTVVEQTDPPHFRRLLRLRGERRREEATSKGADERTPVHYSIT